MWAPDLAARERGVVAVIDVLQARPARERVAHVALVAKPAKPVGKQGKDVNLHRVARPFAARVAGATPDPFCLEEAGGLLPNELKYFLTNSLRS